MYFSTPFPSCHACHSLSPSLSLSQWTLNRSLSYVLMCVRGLRGGGKLWATLLIFHMLHQCRSSDSVGLAWAGELSNTLSTFHWGAVHWLCQDKTKKDSVASCGTCRGSMVSLEVPGTTLCVDYLGLPVCCWITTNGTAQLTRIMQFDWLSVGGNWPDIRRCEQIVFYPTPQAWWGDKSTI